MPFVVFKGERKLTELVERAFGPELTVAERTRAVAALERANPQLATLKDVVPGSLILVPRVPGLAAPAATDEQDPVTDGIHELAGALRAHRKVLGDSIAVGGERVAEVQAIIATPEVREALRAEPGGDKQLEGIATATEERAAGLERTKRAIAEMARVADELVELADRLR